MLIALTIFFHLEYYLKKEIDVKFHASPKERRREEIEKKLEQKAEEERKEVSSQKKELFQTRREKQQELRMLERKMDNAELVSDFSLPNFIVIVYVLCDYFRCGIDLIML